MKRTSILLLALAVLLVSCASRSSAPLPQGPQTIRGYVEAVPFSLKRRGTHVLRQGSGGTLLSYLESREVNMHTLEGKTVTLTGTFERNSDPGLPPVLVVSDVQGAQAERTRPWTIPALGLSLDLPHHWRGSIRGAVAEFTESGAVAPILTMVLRNRPLAGGSSQSGAPPSLESLLVGSRLAYAELLEQTWSVRIRDPEGGGAHQQDLIFSFTLPPSLPSDLPLQRYRAILQTVRFVRAGSSATSSSAAMSAESSSSVTGGEGSPCGGSAGILCPRGTYCRVTDAVADTGTCTKR